MNIITMEGHVESTQARYSVSESRGERTSGVFKWSSHARVEGRAPDFRVELVVYCSLALPAVAVWSLGSELLKAFVWYIYARAYLCVCCHFCRYTSQSCANHHIHGYKHTCICAYMHTHTDPAFPPTYPKRIRKFRLGEDREWKATVSGHRIC